MPSLSPGLWGATSENVSNTYIVPPTRSSFASGESVSGRARPVPLRGVAPAAAFMKGPPLAADW